MEIDEGHRQMEDERIHGIRSRPIMKCGCSGMGTANLKPCCLTHFPRPESLEVMDVLPDMSGRVARCEYCKAEAKSKEDLPFFQFGENYDSYYCGCRGWD